MGLFGLGGKKKMAGLFDTPDYAIDERGAMGGGFQVGMDGGPDAPEMAQAPKQGGGFFGQGGVGRAIAGYLGDALLQQADMQPLYSPMMAQKQTEAFRMKNAEAARAAEREDFLWKQQNAAPKVNDTERDYQFMVQQVGEGPAKDWLRRRGDPFVNMSLPNGQFYAGPQSGLAAALGGGGQAPAAQSGPQEGATATNPQTGAKVQFKGGQWVPMGGAAPSAKPPFSPANGFAPPTKLPSGSMTSGRRTEEGNRLVGGVPGSQHVKGTAADYWGKDLSAVLADVRKLPGLKRAFIHNAGSGRHVHAEGTGWNTPYFGRRGATGAK